MSVLCLPSQFRCSCIFKYLENRQQGLGSERLMLTTIHTLMLLGINSRKSKVFLFLYVSLIVRLSITSDNDELNAQFF
jgi:hypothetical protein